MVVGTFRLPETRRVAARAALERVIGLCRAEPGCIAYSYAEDVLEPGLFRVSEAWTDRAALTAHFESAHMRRWQEERAALGMSERQVTAYTVSGEEEL